MKKLIIITLVITLLSIPAAYSQNIELIATVGGYWSGFREVAGNSQNAFIATQGTTGMLVLDISDPFNPYPVGLLEDMGQLHGGLALSGDIVYLSSLNIPGGTMSVIDVSDPTNPRFFGNCQTQSLIGETFFYEGFCYLTCENTVEIADVSDPYAPQIISQIDPPGVWTNSTVVYDDLAYITSDSGMTIYDIGTPSNPVQLGYFPCLMVYYIDVSGDYAIIESYDEDLILIIDVSDPSDPRQAGSFYLGDDEDCEHIRANGDYVYIARDSGSLQSLYEYGVTILDISDPAHPVNAGCFGELDTYLYFYDNYLYTRSGIKGFKIYEISDPTEPQEIGIYDRQIPKETILKEDFAFVLNHYAGIQVFDISNIYSPVEVNFYYSPGNAIEMKNEGDYIYLADDVAGLRIIDISDPYNLMEAGYYTRPPYIGMQIDLKDNLIFMTGLNTFQILDVTQPDSIFEVYSYQNEVNDFVPIELVDDYAVLAIQDSIHIWDISDPTNIDTVGSCQISASKEGLEIEGNYAYVPEYYPGGLSIINLEDPANPFEEYYILDGVRLQDVEIVGDYCYLALFYNFFKIYNISDPLNPLEIGSYNTSSNGRAVTVYDSIVFFGTNTEFLIFDCSDYVSAGKTAESHKPVTFELLPPYPNPFNASTAISYKLQAASNVNLSIYDVTGREVQSLVDGYLSAGYYEVVWNAGGCGSGVYFVRLDGGEYRQTRKVLLVK